jgi:hypothetical protein
MAETGFPQEFPCILRHPYHSFNSRLHFRCQPHWTVVNCDYNCVTAGGVTHNGTLYGFLEAEESTGQHLASLILKRLEELKRTAEDSLMIMGTTWEPKTKVSMPDSWKWIQELYLCHVGLTHWTWLWLMLLKVMSMPQVTLASYTNCTPCSQPPHTDGPSWKNMWISLWRYGLRQGGRVKLRVSSHWGIRQQRWDPVIKISTTAWQAVPMHLVWNQQDPEQLLPPSYKTAK